MPERPEAQGELVEYSFNSSPPLTHRALPEAPGLSSCTDRNTHSRKQARRQANREKPPKVRKKKATGTMSGRMPSKASPRRKEVQHRYRSGFSSLPDHWLGTMALPQAPAKRYTAVVSKLAIGIMAG